MVNKWYSYPEMATLTEIPEKKLRNLANTHKIDTRKPDGKGKIEAYLPDVINALTANDTSEKELNNELKRVQIAVQRQKLTEERDEIRAQERADYRSVVNKRLEILRDLLREWSTDKKIGAKITEAIEETRRRLDETLEVSQ